MNLEKVKRRREGEKIKLKSWVNEEKSKINEGKYVEVKLMVDIM